MSLQAYIGRGKILTRIIQDWHITDAFWKENQGTIEGVLTYNELRPMLEKYKIFVPKKKKVFTM